MHTSRPATARTELRFFPARPGCRLANTRRQLLESGRRRALVERESVSSAENRRCLSRLLRSSHLGRKTARCCGVAPVGIRSPACTYCSGGGRQSRHEHLPVLETTRLTVASRSVEPNGPSVGIQHSGRKGLQYESCIDRKSDGALERNVASGLSCQPIHAVAARSTQQSESSKTDSVVRTGFSERLDSGP